MRWLDYSSEDGYTFNETKWFYAVAIGRRPGIFTRHEDAQEQVRGFPGFRLRKFGDYEDARDFLEEFEVYCDSLTSEEGENSQEEESDDSCFYAVAVGRSTGVFLNFEDALDQIYGYPGAQMEQFFEYDDAVQYIETIRLVLLEEEKRKLEEERKREEEEEEERKREQERQRWFYAVAVGRVTGVFMNYQDAVQQVRGFSGFKMKKFSDFDETQEYIAFNQVYSSDEESEEEEEEEEWYYAVAVGRTVGIYTDHEMASEQVRGYSGFRMKKFMEYTDAAEYVRSNRICFYEDEEKSEEPEPEEEESPWFYAVAVGRTTGIYRDAENAVAQVHGYPGSKMRKFQDLADAQAYIRLFQVCHSEEEEKSEEHEADGWYAPWFYAVAVGRSVGIYTAYDEAIKQVHGYSGFRMKKFLDYDEAQEYIDFNREYSSGDGGWESEYEDKADTEEGEETRYYAVAVGRRVGVYTNVEDAQEQVHGFSGFMMKKFLNYEKATSYVENNRYISDEEWESDEDPEDDDEKWYYAVAAGRRTGIYTNYQDAVDQVHGYSGFRMKKFVDYSEALVYIKNNREYYIADEYGTGWA